MVLAKTALRSASIRALVAKNPGEDGKVPLQREPGAPWGRPALAITTFSLSTN